MNGYQSQKEANFNKAFKKHQTNPSSTIRPQDKNQ